MPKLVPIDVRLRLWQPVGGSPLGAEDRRGRGLPRASLCPRRRALSFRTRAIAARAQGGPRRGPALARRRPDPHLPAPERDVPGEGRPRQQRRQHPQHPEPVSSPHGTLPFARTFYRHGRA